jgi:ribokinase
MNKPNIVVIGSINMDLVTETERFPARGETVIGQKFRQVPGGKGANQAVAASRLGASVSLIGAIGDDSLGESLKSNLINEKIDIQGLHTIPNQASGIAQITVAEEDNSIIVIPGANAWFTPEMLVEHEELLAKADMIMLQLEIPLETVEKALDLAARHQVPVILNPAPAQELSAELLHKVTYLTPNETELALLSSTLLKNDYDFSTAVQSLLDQGVKQVITTRGSRGAFFYDKNRWELQRSFSVGVVDTTGAGDAFNGGLAVALAKRQPLHEAVRFASAVGALAVTKWGAQSGMPTESDVDQFLAERDDGR